MPMATTDPWFDFEQIRHNIKNNTVERLKQILSGLNEECSTHFPKSGKKQDIIDRIVSVFDSWKASRCEEKWTKAKGVVYQVRTSGGYTNNRTSPNSGLPTAAVPHVPYVTPGLPKNFQTSIAGPSTLPRYDPYARKAAPIVSLPSNPPSLRAPDIRFKDSPFFAIEQAVSSIVECPESTSASDRRQQVLNFTLTNEQIAKLKTPNSRYQLRLFCTSSIFYSGSHAFRPVTIPCPIEFPPTCEVRVNNVQISANLKGLKKKPGTAPPPDLGKYARLSTVQNRVEIVYVNSQQPVQSKKYFLVVMLVQSTSVDQLVANLKVGTYQSSHEVRQRMIDSMTEDDDIIAGPQKMSLKCPLSFIRVNTPCRSTKCVHPQCFDATSWFAVMEQTTTWLCPVCEKVLDHKDLIIDGYFDEILKQTPDAVEDVIVEADGEWHTSDNRYGSTAWRAQHPSIPEQTSQAPPPVPTPSKNPDNSAGIGDKSKTCDVEVLVLDSDDEDEGRVKRELSPSMAGGSTSSTSQTIPGSLNQRTQSQVTEDVIDLTLDSDSDEPPQPRQNGKRKATEANLTSPSPTEQIWKKGRLDPDRALTATILRPNIATTPQQADFPAGPRSPDATYDRSYTGILPPIHLGFNVRGTDRVPPPPPPASGATPYIHRLNGTGSGWRQ